MNGKHETEGQGGLSERVAFELSPEWSCGGVWEHRRPAHGCLCWGMPEGEAVCEGTSGTDSSHRMIW